MTRNKIIFIGICLLLNYYCYSVPRKKASVLYAVGVTGGITYSNQKWIFSNPEAKQTNKYLLGYNGSLFAELFAQDYTSFITELQYNQKGTVEKGTSNRNKLSYISFNNFYRIRYDMEAIMPYILVGPRIEYNLTQSITSSPIPITGNFRKLHVTASVGAGIELLSNSKVKFFTEAHFNPDVMKSYKVDPLSIRAKAFELRIGAKLVFGKDHVACPPALK